MSTNCDNGKKCPCPERAARPNAQPSTCLSPIKSTRQTRQRQLSCGRVNDQQYYGQPQSSVQSQNISNPRRCDQLIEERLTCPPNSSHQTARQQRGFCSNNCSEQQINAHSIRSISQPDKQYMHVSYQRDERANLRDQQQEQRRPASNNGCDQQMDKRTHQSINQAAFINNAQRKTQQEEKSGRCSPCCVSESNREVLEEPPLRLLCRPEQGRSTCRYGMDDRPQQSTYQAAITSHTSRKTQQEEKSGRCRTGYLSETDQEEIERPCNRSTCQSDVRLNRPTCHSPMRNASPRQICQEPQQQPEQTRSTCKCEGDQQIDNRPQQSTYQAALTNHAQRKTQQERRCRPGYFSESEEEVVEEPPYRTIGQIERQCNRPTCQSDGRLNRPTCHSPMRNASPRQICQEPQQQPEQTRSTCMCEGDQEVDNRPQQSTCHAPRKTQQERRCRPGCLSESDQEVVEEPPCRTTGQIKRPRQICQEPQRQPEQTQSTCICEGDQEIDNRPQQSTCHAQRETQQERRCRPGCLSGSDHEVVDEPPCRTTGQIERPCKRSTFQSDGRLNRPTCHSPMRNASPRQCWQKPQQQPEQTRSTCICEGDQQIDNRPQQSTCHAPRKTQQERRCRPGCLSESDHEVVEKPPCSTTGQIERSTRQILEEPQQQPEQRRLTSNGGSQPEIQKERLSRSTGQVDVSPRQSSRSTLPVDGQSPRSTLPVDGQSPRSTLQVDGQSPRSTLQVDEQSPRSTHQAGGQSIRSTHQSFHDDGQCLMDKQKRTFWQISNKLDSDQQFHEQQPETSQYQQQLQPAPTAESAEQKPLDQSPQEQQPAVQTPAMTAAPFLKRSHRQCGCFRARHKQVQGEPMPLADTYVCSRPPPVVQPPKPVPGANCICKTRKLAPKCECPSRSQQALNVELKRQNTTPRTIAQISCGQPMPYRYTAAHQGAVTNCAVKCGHCKATHRTKKTCVIQ